VEAAARGVDGRGLSLRLAVLSTGRQDWGILRSTCLALRDDPAFDLRLMVGGMHTSARFGRTVDTIRADGFLPAETLEWIPDDRASSAAEQAGRAMTAVGGALERQAPDALLLVGDRFETAVAALAATMAALPIVHVHGGEESEGAFDNNFRHAITKLSHLHLVSHPDHRARVIAMGEDPAAVQVVGAPGLDNAHRTDLPSRAELEEFLGLKLAPPVVLVTLHPATLGGDPASEARAAVAAMDAVEATYVITMPNTDPGHEEIRQAFTAAARRPRRVALDALGERLYWGMLRLADAVLGNSSSALIEAPVLSLPAVNVGEREKGRLRGVNVIDVAADGAAIAAGLRRALDPGFRAGLKGTSSPFGDGHSAERIKAVLRAWRPPRPPVKRALMAAHA
jgi:UDP-N-acetylglucosamine 2-epimerase (non-hydrolysing)